MGIVEAPKLMHWEFFLSLEDDLLKISRYIEITSDNFGCYSIELARLLLSASSEVDVVAKQICKQLNNKSRARSIGSYMHEITGTYREIGDFEVLLKRFQLTLTPWTNWCNDKSPYWWTDHNKVKHRRHQDFEKASLGNVLNATAGLFVLLLYFYKSKAEMAELEPNPRLFAVTDYHSGGYTEVDGTLITNYQNLC